MSELDLQQTCRLAIAWTREAGDIALASFGKVRATRKADQSLVTDVDLQLQEFILSRIAQHYPNHFVVAEEEDNQRTPPASSHEYCWAVDPLDGTRNYVRGFPVFCVSLALMRGRQPVLGVIHDPMCNRTYSSIKNEGAYLNDHKVAVSQEGWHQDTLIAIPTGKSHKLPSPIYRDWLVRGVLRNTGSTALHLALVATGALDACYGQEAKLWDLAAGALLVEEAGGVITDPQGGPALDIDPTTYRDEDLAFLAGGKVMHGELLKTLR